MLTFIIALIATLAAMDAITVFPKKEEKASKEFIVMCFIATICSIHVIIQFYLKSLI